MIAQLYYVYVKYILQTSKYRFWKNITVLERLYTLSNSFDSRSSFDGHTCWEKYVFFVNPPANCMLLDQRRLTIQTGKLNKIKGRNGPAINSLHYQITHIQKLEPVQTPCQVHYHSTDNIRTHLRAPRRIYPYVRTALRTATDCSVPVPCGVGAVLPSVTLQTTIIALNYPKFSPKFFYQ